MKPTERAQVLLKSGNRNFLNIPPFERLACFYEIISRNFERFQYFNFKTDFLENENLFKKLEYRFSVESTKIEIASFLYKTTLSEANSMVNTKWTYHIELSTLFYRKFYFSIRTFYKELSWYTDKPNAHIRTFYKELSWYTDNPNAHICTFYKELSWYTDNPNAHIRTFCKHWILFDGAFPVSILKKTSIKNGFLKSLS